MGQIKRSFEESRKGAVIKPAGDTEIESFCKCMLGAKYRYSEEVVQLISKGLSQTAYFTEWTLEELLSEFETSCPKRSGSPESLLREELGSSFSLPERFEREWSDLKAEPVFTFNRDPILSSQLISFSDTLINTIKLLLVAALLKSEGKSVNIKNCFTHLKPEIFGQEGISTSNLKFNSNSQIFMIAESMSAINNPKSVYEYVGGFEGGTQKAGNQAEYAMDFVAETNRLIKDWSSWLDSYDTQDISKEFDISIIRYETTSAVMRVVRKSLAYRDNATAEATMIPVRKAAEQVRASRDLSRYSYYTFQDNLNRYWEPVLHSLFPQSGLTRN